MKNFFLALLLFLPLSAAAFTLDELRQQLAADPIVRCRFTQERRINGLARPLKSSGEMLLARGHGLWWHQQKPFPMTVLLDPQKMVQTLPGQPPQIISAEKQPQLFQFNQLLLDLFQADATTLEKSFAVSFSSADGKSWQLVLVPRTAPIDKVFRRITLSGSRHPETLLLEDTQNDRTTLRFLDHQTAPATLTAEEKARFNPPPAVISSAEKPATRP